jgi:hypothetical protein
MPIQPTRPTETRKISGSNVNNNSSNNNNKSKRVLTDPYDNKRNNNNNNNAIPQHNHIVHKKPTLEDTIEHVFTVLRDQSELDNGIPVPPKFFYFYDSEMLRHFLACVVYYFYAFTQVKDLESDLMNSPSDEHTKLQLKESRNALQQRLRIFAEAYCRLLLHCSNFEHTQEDQSFFEFLFEFTRTTCRMAVAEEQWESIDEALGHVFRGYMFNTDSLRSPRANRHNNNKNKNNNMKNVLSGRGNNNNFHDNQHFGKNIDGTDAIMINDDTMNGNINGNTYANNTNNDNDDDGSISNKPDEVKLILKKYARKKNDEFFKVANRLQTNTAEAERAIDLAKKIIASHKHKITRVPRAKSVRSKHNEVVKMTKLSHLNEKRLGLAVNIPSERPRDFSFRKTFNTRSPMISLLLPTPTEKLEIAMMHYNHKKKMEIQKSRRRGRKKGPGTRRGTAGKESAVRLPGVLHGGKERGRTKQVGLLSGVQ